MTAPQATDPVAFLDRLEEAHEAIADYDVEALLAEHNAMPALIAAVRAVLALAEELEVDAQRQVDHYPPDSDVLPAVVGRCWVNAARQFRSAVTAVTAALGATGGERQ